MSEEKFSYSYSAERHREISRITEKYLPGQENKSENKLERMKRLDASCERAAMIAGLSLGIVGTLVFGVALTCFLVWEAYVIGAMIAAVSLPMIVFAKPLYDKVLRDRRAKAAPEILRLSRELEGEG